MLQTSTVPTSIELIGDALGYVEWGQRIAAGDWYGSETFYQAPLYPYFLAIIFKFVSASITVVRLIQVLLGSAGVVLLAIAVRHQFNDRVALIAAFMLAFYPPSIYYDGLIQKAALSSFLICALLAAVALLSERFKPTWAIVVGVVLGLLVLTRENALLWLPLLPLWMLLSARDESWASRVKVVAGYAVGLVVVLFPVAYRNASLGGEWSPTTFQSGPNFYIGNNLDANGVYSPLIAGHETPEFERADAKRIAEQQVGRELSSREVSMYWMRLAKAEIAEDPVRWCQLMLLKVGLVMNRYEVPDVESFYVHRYWSVPLRILQYVWHFGFLVPLAIVGLFLTHQRWRELWLSYALILSMVFAVAMFFVLGRYRLPLVPLLIPFAAFALVDWRRLFQLSSKARVACLCLFVFSLAIANLPLNDEQGLTASSYMNVGISAGQAGDLPTCLTWLEAAAELDGTSAVTHYNLAGAQAMSGRRVEAIRSLLLAKKLDPELVQVDVQLATLYEQLGRPAEALEYYRRALRIEPSDPVAISGVDRLLNSP